MGKADLFRNGGAALAVALVAGCSAPPLPGVSSGTLPAGPAAGFTIVKPEADIPQQTVADLVQCLTKGGMNMGGTPAYFVQIAHTLRPGKILVLLPDLAATPTAIPAQPAPVRAHADRPAAVQKGLFETMTITVINNQAEELFRASATQAVKEKPGATKASAAALTGQLCRSIAKPV